MTKARPRKTRKRRYKVLPLPPFVERATMYESEDDFELLHVDTMEEMGYERCPTRFKQDGWYYDRQEQFSWFVSKGEGWTGKRSEVGQFLYELHMLDIKPLEKAEVEAINVLQTYRRIPRDLQRMYIDSLYWYSHRDVYRDSRMAAARIVGWRRTLGHKLPN